MAPLRGKPGVVEVQPADHRADVEGGVHRVELELGARHARAIRHRGALDDRAEQLVAGRVFERLEAAAQRVHQAVARRGVRVVALYLEILRVAGNQRQDLVRLRPDIGNMGRHYFFSCSFSDSGLKRYSLPPALGECCTGSGGVRSLPLWSHQMARLFSCDFFSSGCSSRYWRMNFVRSDSYI